MKTTLGKELHKLFAYTIPKWLLKPIMKPLTIFVKFLYGVNSQSNEKSNVASMIYKGSPNTANSDKPIYLSACENKFNTNNSKEVKE